MSNPYKCKTHKLDLICHGCVKAWVARHDKMLAFIKELASENIYPQFTAKLLLKERGVIE